MTAKVLRMLPERFAQSQRRAPAVWPNLDRTLLLALVLLTAIGLVMVASASVSIAERHYGDPLFFLRRQVVFLVLGLAVAAALLHTRLESWERAGVLPLLFAYFLLILVLIPGVGHEVNGAVRWISLEFFNLQVSEPAKLLVMIYLAGYLVRRNVSVQTTMRGFLLPVGLLFVCGSLLLKQPDFGATAVLIATGMGMLFLAGVPFWRFGLLGAGLVGLAAALIVGSPYRWERLTGFLNPWADPFASGFQLTQSLIAIGRGEWFGVGAGGSVQKLFYLPEAHTDFVFAVLTEEFGLIGALVVMGLYAVVVARAFAIGARGFRVERPFAGFLAYGIGIWLVLQVFVNVGVTLGLLPTTGMTLPLVSYGGSSLIVTLATLALLLRADYETRIAGVAARHTGAVS